MVMKCKYKKEQYAGVFVDVVCKLNGKPCRSSNCPKEEK